MLWVEPFSNTVLRVPPDGCALATALPGSYDYVDPRPQVGEPRRIGDTTRLVGWDGPTPKELLRTARGGEHIAKGQRLSIEGRGGSRSRVAGSRYEGDLWVWIGVSWSGSESATRDYYKGCRSWLSRCG